MAQRDIDNVLSQIYREINEKGAPKRVRPVPRFESDLKALRIFFDRDDPPKVPVRSSNLKHVYYGFGDASGNGFGSSIRTKEGLSLRIGVWGGDEQKESSNFREFENVVSALESEGRKRHLNDTMIFFFTDNSTVEGALYKGTSSSPKLLNLVVRFNALQAHYDTQIIVSHVSGKRMIAQGADGLSRDAENDGTMGGQDIMDFIPLHQSPLERSPQLKTWLFSWLPSDARILSPSDWFVRGHDIIGGEKNEDGIWTPTIKLGTYIWDLPPAAAEVALEELRKARIKRQDSLHVVLIPRLLTPMWQKQLFKAADIVLWIPPILDCWPAHMFEPCCLAFLFPFIRSAPWQLRGTPRLMATGRKLSKLWKDDQVDGRDILRELLVDCERFRTMPGSVVRKMLFFE